MTHRSNCAEPFTKRPSRSPRCRIAETTTTGGYSLTLPEGGTSITQSAAHENMQPGTMKLYFATLDVAAAHKELSAKGTKVNEVKDDLFGPGSGEKW